jgi:hypothetical protein
MRKIKKKYPLPEIQQKIIKYLKEHGETYYIELAGKIGLGWSSYKINTHLECLKELKLVIVFMKLNGCYHKYVKLRK